MPAEISRVNTVGKENMAPRPNMKNLVLQNAVRAADGRPPPRHLTLWTAGTAEWRVAGPVRAAAAPPAGTKSRWADVARFRHDEVRERKMKHRDEEDRSGMGGKWSRHSTDSLEKSTTREIYADLFPISSDKNESWRRSFSWCEPEKTAGIEKSAKSAVRPRDCRNPAAAALARTRATIAGSSGGCSSGDEERAGAPATAVASVSGPRPSNMYFV